jgi:shikimate kinase
LLEGGDRAQRIRELLAARETRYAQAHVSVDTGDLTVEQVVEKIIGAIEGRALIPCKL